MSFDGRFVSFDAFAYDLVPGDTNYSPDTFVHDRRTRRTARVSVASDGTQGDSWTGNHLMSADGRYLAFGTVASNLFAHDANGYGYDIVVAAVQRPEIDAVHPDTLQPGDRATITVQGAWFTPDAHVAFGPGITVERTRLTSPTTLEARVRVASGAEPGSRHVDVVNPGTGAGALTGTAERLPDALTVQ